MRDVSETFVFRDFLKTFVLRDLLETFVYQFFRFPRLRIDLHILKSSTCWRFSQPRGAKTPNLPKTFFFNYFLDEFLDRSLFPLKGSYFLFKGKIGITQGVKQKKTYCPKRDPRKGFRHIWGFGTSGLRKAPTS